MLMRNEGWCVFIVVQGRRQFVRALENGEPSFTFAESEALFGEECEAEQLAEVVERLYEGARAMYVPYSVRKSFADPWMLAR
ncbi:hypothetical protein EGT07_14830 [Herbaspirillum sp. HC18]|nr:hypothetical protein EGT07_14830 [Herbaspirillum sp. HC18]